MIDILLSTFNGESFLVEQMDSILGQSFGSFNLLVRDDGSTDGTLGIIGKYAAADERVSLVTDDKGNLGSSASFIELVGRSNSPYFMLADQDDVWLPDKTGRSFEKLKALEKKHGPEVPLLVFTDLRVVGRDLTTIDDSFWHFQRLDPGICRDWKRLLVQNVVTGSTVIANAATRKRVLPFTLNEMMHDHWIAVNAAKNGIVDYDEEPTVLYRQHSSNAEGARRAGAGYLAGKAPSLVARFSFYRKAAAYFGDTTALELALLKIRLNLRRLFS